MRARAYPSLATLSVLLAACASHGDPSRARAAMLDDNRVYSSAFLNHDASAVGARFTDSAVVTLPGMPDVRRSFGD